MGTILLLFVLMIGVLYFRLHALPERFAHKKGEPPHAIRLLRLRRERPHGG
jgi:hypothetical protein